MKIDKVRLLSPQERLLSWIEERERIRLLKEGGYPKPWTDDEILASYRFCNVRRMDDKVSRWLLEHYYEYGHGYTEMLAVAALCRFVNLPSSLDLIRVEAFMLDRETGEYGRERALEDIKHKLRQHRDRGNTVFNGAYVVRGNDGQDKIECVVDYYVRPLIGRQSELVDTSSMKRAHDRLKQEYGFGSFMAGQVVADLRWALGECRIGHGQELGDWADRYDWAPEGPGSKRGLNRLMGRPPEQSMHPRVWATEFPAMMSMCQERLPSGIVERLEAHDYQNCLCEYDKYVRALDGEGKPKQRYPGS